MQIVLRKEAFFDELCCSRLNLDKTKVQATTPHLHKKAALVEFNNCPIKAVKHLKALGNTLSSCFRASHVDADARAFKAIDTVKRARRSLAPWIFRKRVFPAKCSTSCVTLPSSLAPKWLLCASCELLPWALFGVEVAPSAPLK